MYVQMLQETGQSSLAGLLQLFRPAVHLSAGEAFATA